MMTNIKQTDMYGELAFSQTGLCEITAKHNDASMFLHTIESVKLSEVLSDKR